MSLLSHLRSSCAHSFADFPRLRVEYSQLPAVDILLLIGFGATLQRLISLAIRYRSQKLNDVEVVVVALALLYRLVLVRLFSSAGAAMT